MNLDLNHALTRARDLAHELEECLREAMRIAHGDASLQLAFKTEMIDLTIAAESVYMRVALIASEATLPPIVVKEIVGKCPYCLGKVKPSIGCFVCGGLGIAKTGQTIEVNECPRCTGKGCDNHNNLCSLCGGTGISETEKSIAVKDVPKDVPPCEVTWHDLSGLSRVEFPSQPGGITRESVYFADAPKAPNTVAEPVANVLRTWLEAPTCRRCHAPMQRGQALANTLVSTDDFGGDAGQAGSTFSPTGPAEMVACWKCPECGHSFRTEGKR